MKKNNLDDRLTFDQFLVPVNFLLRLSAKAYEKYMVNKIYLHALNIRKSNEMVYQLMINNLSLIPDDLQNDCILLLNHYDCWMHQFREEEEKRKPLLTDEFIFYRADEQVAFPRLSEEKILETYKKWRKQKNK